MPPTATPEKSTLQATDTQAAKPGFAADLTQWYRDAYRRLPWRETTDAYAIWLSEIMLQQTQVATVIPYYKRFLKAYPTLQTLAQAPLDEVLKQWEGLGYYARCRNLHKAATIIVSDYQGVFPTSLKEVENLPGIGKSTAGAILTFSAGQRHPILDGNVKRVLARLFNIETDINARDIQPHLWQLSDTLLSAAEAPEIYNQAIMELGAVVCTPNNPSCLLCPVRVHCEGFVAGAPETLPVKALKKPVPHHTIAVGVIWKAGKVLIQKRPEKGLLGGLWEFPGGKQEKNETLPQTVQREIQEELGIGVCVEKPITVVKHAYTHFKITLHAFHCTYQSGTPTPKAADDWRWVTPEDLPLYAFPKANKRVLETILQTLSEK